MLKKLIKHDFLTTGRVLLPLFLILFGITLLGFILGSTKLFSRPVLVPMGLILLIVYFLALIAIGLITGIYLIVYFYRNHFTSQGYLTFTLPVSPWSLLHSKVITGFVWTIIEFLLIFGSLFLVLGAAFGFDTLGSGLDFMINGTGTFTLNGETISVISPSLSELFGLDSRMLLLFIVLLMLSAAFFSVLSYYGSVAIGQLYAKHKVAGTVLTYLGIYFLTQIVNIILTVVVSIRSVTSLVSTGPFDVEAGMEAFTEFTRSIYSTSLFACIILYLVLSIALYVVSGIIMKKRVNLD